MALEVEAVAVVALEVKALVAVALEELDCGRSGLLESAAVLELLCLMELLQGLLRI